MFNSRFNVVGSELRHHIAVAPSDRLKEGALDIRVEIYPLRSNSLPSTSLPSTRRHLMSIDARSASVEQSHAALVGPSTPTTEAYHSVLHLSLDDDPSTIGYSSHWTFFS